MARPCKSVNTMSKNLTKEEKIKRLVKEEKLKCGANEISPPSYLSETQREIFLYIVDQLKQSNILGNLDVFILSQCSIAIDRLRTIETMINKEYQMLMDKDLMSAKDKYTKDLFRCCNELSLSPQSRAKLANINLQSKEKDEDPLLKVLRGEE